MRIEIDVLSGRPNPGWVLTAEEATELRSLLIRAAQPDATSIPDVLGFRGFLVQEIGEATGLGPGLRVYQGLIYKESEKAVMAWQDLGGAEAWLRRQAIRHGMGELLP